MTQLVLRVESSWWERSTIFQHKTSLCNFPSWSIIFVKDSSIHFRLAWVVSSLCARCKRDLQFVLIQQLFSLSSSVTTKLWSFKHALKIVPQISILLTVLQRFVKVFLLFSDSVMVLLRELGRGYLALCSYNCREAINILTSLPPLHYNTGWVLTHIGRAYFELAEYTQVSHNWQLVSVHTHCCIWTGVLCL